MNATVFSNVNSHYYLCWQTWLKPDWNYGGLCVNLSANIDPIN